MCCRIEWILVRVFFVVWMIEMLFWVLWVVMFRLLICECRFLEIVRLVVLFVVWLMCRLFESFLSDFDRLFCVLDRLW